MNKGKTHKLKCPVCGEYTIDDPFDICPACGWENDKFQNERPDFAGGANRLSLNQYRKWLAAKRAEKPDFYWERDMATQAGEEDEPKKTERPKK
jgi:hypothetical protein